MYMYILITMNDEIVFNFLTPQLIRTYLVPSTPPTPQLIRTYLVCSTRPSPQLIRTYLVLSLKANLDS